LYFNFYAVQKYLTEAPINWKNNYNSL